MAKTGRPSVINADTVLKLEQAFRDGFSVSRACELSGIGRTAYYKRLESDEDFTNKMKLAQEWPLEQARQVVVNAIKTGDLSAAKWLLEKKASDEFGNRAQISVDTPVPVSQEVVLSDLDDLIEWRKATRELRRNGTNYPSGQPSSVSAKE